MTDDMLLTSSQVAHGFGISSQTVRRWTRDGLLRCQFTRGGHRRFRMTDVEALLSHLNEAAGPGQQVGRGAPSHASA